MICSNTVKKYCCEDISLIENYNKAINDNTQTWHLHHKLEIDKNLSIKELKSMNMYYHRPANELIFLPPFEHNRLHSKGKPQPWNSHPHSEETKQKMRLNHADVNGENNPMYGKNHSEETKKKISDKLKGHKPWNKGISPTEETKRKISESNKGKPHPWNSHPLSEETKCKMSESHKGKHLTEETKCKMSESHKGKHWKLINGKRIYY